MSTTTTTRVPSSPTATTNNGNLYDGYATIRARGLYRQRSIRAASLEAAVAQKESQEYTAAATTRARRRTLSLMSNCSLSSGSVGPAEHIYASTRHSAKHVLTPTVHDIETEAAYANASSIGLKFRPMSDDSSSSGAGSNGMNGSRDHGSDVAGTGSTTRKNFRFSLDSLHSNITPKTPDCEATTEEEENENIFLYTAPKSPKRLMDSSLSPYYSPVPRTSFEMSDHSGDTTSSAIMRRRLERTPSSASSHYKSPNNKTLMSNSFHYGDQRDNCSFYQSTGQLTSPTSAPPTAPVRRESLYATPYRFMSTPHQSPYKSTNAAPLQLEPIENHNVKNINFAISQRSSSVDMLERSQTSQSLATIDQDEILIVPTAMPVLQNDVDKRYHTLGHMRVQSLGASLHRTYEFPHHYYNFMGNNSTQDLLAIRSNKSAGNIYASADEAIADLNRLAPEYVDPLDFKIGCQSTLRSKPVIPWYELAIRRDVKRQSLPAMNSSPIKLLDNNSLNNSYHSDDRCNNDGRQAHVVSAFEQSLSNMTSRLQQLTATAERKDGELTDMRQTIELLRKQSIQAGLTTAHMQSMGVQTQNQVAELGITQKTPLHNASTTQPQLAVGLNGNNNNGLVIGGPMQRHHSSDSMCSLNSIGSNCSAQDKSKKKKGWLRSSFTKAFSRNAKISKTSRHIPGHHGSDQRMSGHLTPKHHHASNADQVSTNTATPNGGSPAKTVTLIENAKPIDAIDHDEQQMVEELKKQLREKDLVLTDIRLEALSSASQLESLKETVNKMRAEMMSLKQNNERLQKLVTSRSLAGSELSLGNAISPNGSVNESRRFSLADSSARPPMELPKRLDEEVEEENIPPAPAPEPPPTLGSPTTHIDLTPPPPALETRSNAAHMPLTVEELNDVTDGKKIAIACYLGQPESFRKYCEEMLEADSLYANARISCSNGAEAEGSDLKNSYHSVNLNEFVIAYTYISGKTTWQNLDYIVRKTFKDYVARIDPGTNLGLNTDSITSYHLGEAKRGPEMGFPELLPCGYIIGNVRTLYICLQGVGSLAFDSLIPRSIVHRYISLLTEHRRLILCGPSGTGKSYLARRLAEFLVARSVRINPSEAIATFNVDHKSSKDLRQYLSHIAEQAAIANGASELPAVIILDNLHHASALGDVFSCLLSAGPAGKLPCIIGTMSQATCNTTNLQLHHNFRWVLTANHMEPVKGFLGRFLRRRLFQMELQSLKSQPELASVLAWLPTVWQHINRFLEIHSSSDVTIGPRLFLTCPLDLKDSQIWFTDVWNYHLAPYLVEAVREGVQLYGRRGGPWNDPSIFIRNSYPWPYGPDSVAPLRQINAEDVGLEGVAGSSGENQDPLLNMLMRLQEAANYSENQDPESDCASLDSNITPDSSAGAE